MKKKLMIVMAITLLFTLSSIPSWAATTTATASISVSIGSTAKISLSRDDNSVNRGSTDQVLFDRRDDQDGQADGDAGYMYAPYRSETNKNWHVVKIVANGTSVTLSASVTGVVSTTPLANILKVWCGGFFRPGTSTPLPGTASPGEWEYLNGWQRTLSQPFIGVVPFNYQLNISEVDAGTYTGTITFTVTSS